MRRTWLIVSLLLSCAAVGDAAAQGAPSRPPRDTVRMGRAGGDSIRMAGGEEGAAPAAGGRGNVRRAPASDDAAGDSVPRPGPYARAAGRGPFTVQAAGEPAARPARGEVVWVTPAPAPRVAARDTARGGSRPAARDTARSGSGQRVTTSASTRRDTASASRPQTPASRPAARDTVRIGGGGRTGPAAARDTARRTGGQAAANPAGGRTQPAASTPPAASGGVRPRSHTVAAGETFYGIARRYGVTAAQLRALNPGVDVDALRAGEVLRLPAAARDSRAGAAPAATPRTGSRPAAGRTQSQPPRGSRTHTVTAGETLYGIARRYGVPVDAIRRANQMETDQVRTGQRLVIPPAP